PENIDGPVPAGRQPVIEDPDHLPACTMQPVGVVHSPYRNHFDTPRQPAVAAQCDGWVVLRRGLQNLARDLRGFERIWILFQFNYSRGWRHTVVPPRDNIPRGLFATRCPHRPNPIGLSCVRLLNVVGRKILIRDHDLLHGTPVLDIKPYLPYCEAWPDAAAGWVDELTHPGPDHRWE
ncbi:MAG: tRNA (N6-threonylcarbamoyladenosine(37)-N6)-methyltransferase TrmO, partial [Planctomycetota bacterium]